VVLLPSPNKVSSDVQSMTKSLGGFEESRLPMLMPSCRSVAAITWSWQSPRILHEAMAISLTILPARDHGIYSLLALQVTVMQAMLSLLQKYHSCWFTLENPDVDPLGVVDQL
jgi:hypothetical protein